MLTSSPKMRKLVLRKIDLVAASGEKSGGRSVGCGTALQTTVFPASGSSCRSCGGSVPSHIAPTGLAGHF